MQKNSIEAVIKSYKNEDIENFLNGARRRSITYDVSIPVYDSIQNLIEISLKNVDESTKIQNSEIYSSEYILQPDIHGRFDLFIQNLYATGLIDKEANWTGGSKTLIMLGDMISRGPYSTEVLVYTMALMKQAEAKNGKVIPLLGNHEHLLINDYKIDFYNINEINMVKQMIIKHIKSDEIKLSFADNEKNIFCVHAGVEKTILKMAISRIKPELERKLQGKISSIEIHKIMEQNNIKIKDISDWMNDELKKDLSVKNPLLAYYSSGVIETRKKNFTLDTQDIDIDKIYKFIQFAGHTTTSFSENLINSKNYGAIKKINHKFYLDYDLLRGNRTIVAINKDKIYQLYSKENWLNQNFRPQDQIDKGIPRNLICTAGCYHGNTYKLDIKSWELTLIGIIPNKDKINTLKMQINNQFEKNKNIGNSLMGHSSRLY